MGSRMATSGGTLVTAPGIVRVRRSSKLKLTVLWTILVVCMFFVYGIVLYTFFASFDTFYVSKLEDAMAKHPRPAAYNLTMVLKKKIAETVK
jgi:hypothetical protein